MSDGELPKARYRLRLGQHSDPDSFGGYVMSEFKDKNQVSPMGWKYSPPVFPTEPLPTNALARKAIIAAMHARREVNGMKFFTNLDANADSILSALAAAGLRIVEEQHAEGRVNDAE